MKDPEYITDNMCRIEKIAYIGLALFILVFIYYLYYLDPVNYVRLVAEDQPGEYATAACFGLAGGLLLLLAFRKGRGVRRVMWAMIGLIALFIAGEELSWGQRILGISTPEFFLQLNMQREINIHNMAFLPRMSWTAGRSLVVVRMVRIISNYLEVVALGSGLG